MDGTPVQFSVLIIESDPLTAELYSRELRPYFKVVTLSDEPTAISYLTHNDPSVVVLEPASFGKDGWDFLTTIKALPKMASVPIILCSTLDERRKGLEMGAVSFLLKPVLPSTLMHVLRQITHYNPLPSS